jgi:hypothetical protein
MKGKYLFLVLGLCWNFTTVNGQISYAGEQPGEARLTSAPHQLVLENKVIRIKFSDAGGKWSVTSFENRKTGNRLTFPANTPLFVLDLTDGSRVGSADFALEEKPTPADAPAEPDAVIPARRIPGKKISAHFVNKKIGLSIQWVAELRDGSNYIRQILQFSPKDSVNISRISLISLPAGSGMRQAGTVDGTPMVNKNMFFAVEHPMSKTETKDSVSTVFLPRSLPLTADPVFVLSSVWGVTPAGQLRRGFLYYLERERANPYHQFLHYNSWFDISFPHKILTDSLCLDRIQVFGDSLITRRKTPMDAFLFDDGWDDYKTLWQFNKGFPDGFSNVRDAAMKYHAGIGVWMSPWGGYDQAKPQRLAYGAKQDPPFETNENGFSLAGPVYFKRFSEVAENFVKKYNVSIFKIDGVGAGNGASGASLKYQRDVEALLRLIHEIRTLKPDIFLSLTVGTWPSVYWLKYGDVIWRAGGDTGVRGKGSKRQQWINYRDAQTYKNIVQRAPLYPLSSVMNHGLCIADGGLPGKLEMDPKDIADEMWSFFGTGTSLEEMYVNPHKLNSANWDLLSEVIKWARSNASEMPDTHWIGGDPAKEEVYGYAAWSSKGAYLTLRNPSDQPKTFKVETSKVFDLPPGTSRQFAFYDARAAAGGERQSAVAQGETFTVTLKPFELKVFDAVSKTKK